MKSVKDYQRLLSRLEGREVTELEVAEFLLGYEEFLDQVEAEVEQDYWEEHG